MKISKNILFIISILLVLFSCSTKKDTVISRNYHALTTKYNVLFNGKEAFNLGLKNITDNYRDNWFNQLPLEPIKFVEKEINIEEFVQDAFGSGPLINGFDTPKAKTKKATSPFTIAEEKAVKAIQKHGMNINGIERNRQIDDAYLLLGKSRYYSQRFIPALEAFNYVIASYPNANLIAETRIWRAKTNIRLENEELAIESLKILLKEKDSFASNLPDNIKEQGHTALAMAYIQSDSLQKAKKHLYFATKTLVNREQSARNLFVLGQIYSKEKQKDSAISVFKKLQEFKKAPYKYKIHATIEIAKNTHRDSSVVAVINKLQELIKDRDNRPYLDELYYQVGVLHENRDSIKKAIKSYNNSLWAKGAGTTQKSFSYEKLGNLYFKNTNYLLASAYYDSVLKIAPDEFDIRIKRIKRKHSNLASLIKLENIVSTNDSILNLASLTKQEQETFFTKYIARLKKKDKELAQLKLNQAAYGASFSSNSLQSKQGNWYFYNTKSLSFGKTEFQKIWGKRQLQDNWRWESNIDGNSNNQNQKNITSNRYNLASYINSIPTKTTILDSLKIERNEALFELGLIYKEQFNNPNRAILRLERLASLQPKKELNLPINWHLYQIYSKLNNTPKANFFKDFILTQHPNSVFAKIINNPNKKISQEPVESKTAKKYKEVYYLYKKNKFKETITKIDSFLPTIQNSALVSKFELLKAFAIGKISDKNLYIKALENVVINFSETLEGKEAQKVINKLSK